MSYAGSWVADAVDTLGIADRVRRVDEPERSEVLGRVTGTFLNRPTATFWWEHLKVPASSWQTANGHQHLPRLAPDAEAACWLITGLTDADDEKAVFRCTPALAPSVIAECPFFEYALVAPDLRWMVIENHHDFLIATGEALERLDWLKAEESSGHP
jgi:hypothetical protein